MTIFICFENRTRKHARYILVIFLAQQTPLFNVGSKGKLQIRRASLSATKVDEKCCTFLKSGAFAFPVNITRTVIFISNWLPFHVYFLLHIQQKISKIRCFRQNLSEQHHIYRQCYNPNTHRYEVGPIEQLLRYDAVSSLFLLLYSNLCEVSQQIFLSQQASAIAFYSSFSFVAPQPFKPYTDTFLFYRITSTNSRVIAIYFDIFRKFLRNIAIETTNISESVFSSPVPSIPCG